jgi:hypothetical protein
MSLENEEIFNQATWDAVKKAKLLKSEPVSVNC